MNFLSYLKHELTGALKKLDLKEYEPSFDRPRDDKFGDIFTNVALIAAKNKKRLPAVRHGNPKETAKEIVAKLDLSDDYISEVEIAPAGFINLFLSKKYLQKNLEDILKLENNYGKLDTNANKTANIEWVSANPTGPLHAGHGRHIALGKAVANLLEWSGYKVTREYYFNNAGKQMDNLAASVYARYRQFFEPSFPLPENAYAGDYIKDIAALIKQEYDDRLLDSQTDLFIFKTAGENWCFKSIRRTLDRLGIHHNIFSNEDSLYKENKIEKILDDFKKKNLSYEKDGAVWLRLTDLRAERSNPKNESDPTFEADKVIVKATGEPTYRLPDMAYHIDKIKRGYDAIIDIFGADHADTYKEVLAGVKALGYDTSKVKVILHQMVTFVQEGKPVKMSKRAGDVYYLDDLLDDVGSDVAQFFFVMRSANTHLDFDVKLAKEQSEKNPVFYLQYAHARICGITRNAKSAETGLRPVSAGSARELLNQPEEVSVLRKLAFFPYTVESSYLSLEPHKIITYLNELAESFHIFYHNHRVINQENKELSQARLALCTAVRTVLANGFSILGISAPERM